MKMLNWHGLSYQNGKVFIIGLVYILICNPLNKACNCLNTMNHNIAEVLMEIGVTPVYSQKHTLTNS